MTSIANTISEITRRNVFEEFLVERSDYSGVLSEVDFLSRLYDLSALPSTDRRYATAAQDIWQHRVRNRDWPDDWFYKDYRFNLLKCTDEEFIAFLCEMLHPIVRSTPFQNDEEDNVPYLLDMFNTCLAVDGWRIVKDKEISGRPVFKGYRGTPPPSDDTTTEKVVAINSERIRQAWRKCLDRRESDPEGAITSARTLLEDTCKHVLDEEGVPYDESADLPKLYYLVSVNLDIAPSQQTADILRKVFGSCQAIVEGLGALRNKLGDAHGRSGLGPGPTPRHAELAVNLAGTMATFLISTWEALRTGNGRETGTGGKRGRT